MEEYQKKLAAMKALREQSQKTLPTNTSTPTTTPKPTTTATTTTNTNPPLVKNPSNSSISSNNFNNSAPKPSTLQKSGSNLSLSSTNSSPSIPSSSSGSSSTNVSSSTPSSPSVSRTAFSLSSASSQSRLRTGSAPVAPPSSSSYTPHTVGYNLPSKNSPSSTSSSSLSNFKPSTPSTPTAPSTPTPSITTTPSSPSLSSSSTPNSTPSTPTTTETTTTTPTRNLITRTGSVSASSSPVLSRSGSVGASNATTPIKSELDDVKQKLELETKLRYEAERKYQEKVRELATVKMQMQKNALAEMSKGVSRPPGAGGSSSGSSLLNASKDPTRQSVRMSKRVSVRPNGSNLAVGGVPGAGGPLGGSGSRLSVRPSARRSTMVVANQLTSLVSEITKIEVAVTAAHAAREEAEQRLYDICVEKLMVDGVLKKVVQNLFGVEAGLRSVTDPKVSKARNEIVESIAYAVKECGLDITMPGTPSSDSAPPSSIPTPPANPNSSSKPPPPPPMTAARSLAATQVVVGGGSQASLLDQIRGGKSLKQIDLQKLKEEKNKSDKNKRKSMLQLKSLTDTLREALFARADDLLGADEEEDEDDEDWME